MGASLAQPHLMFSLRGWCLAFVLFWHARVRASGVASVSSVYARVAPVVGKSAKKVEAALLSQVPIVDRDFIEIVSHIGHGRFSEVFHAIDVRSNTSVVLKVRISIHIA
jgi:hypothetical protein